ncbi:MAG: glycosyltransferase [Fidelibacterota bacterium]
MTVAIVSVNKDKYSETFIKAQVENLPTKVHFLHTGYLPILAGWQDIPIVKPSLITSFQKWIGYTDERILEFALSRYLIRKGIHLVLAQYGPSGVKMMRICRKKRIPLFVYFRGYDAYRKEILDSYGQAYPKLFKIASRLFVVSKDMRDQLIRLGADAEKIVYNPSGADTGMFRWSDAGKNPVNFLSVGRFEETKDHALTIRAFSQLVKQYPKARLLIAGDGPMKRDCEKLVSRLNLGSSVEFKGIIPHSQVADLMVQMRGFILHSVTPSSGDKEGTPVSIMEASASGLPVISTRHAGIPEVVIDKETGFLVEEYDEMGTVDSMLRIAKDADLATRLGKAGHDLISRNFTQKQNINNLWLAIRQFTGEVS